MQIMGMAGPIGAERALEVVNAYSLAFFDRQLKGRQAPLLDGPSPEFPEAPWPPGLDRARRQSNRELTVGRPRPATGYNFCIGYRIPSSGDAAAS